MLGDENTLEEKIAKHRVVTAMLELALKKRDMYQIEAETRYDLFVIKGKINNFRFEYHVHRFRHSAVTRQNEHVIMLETEGENSEKVKSTSIDDRTYMDLSDSNKVSKELREAFSGLYTLILEKANIYQNIDEAYEEIKKQKRAEIKEIDEATKMNVDAMVFGQMLMNRIIKEIKCNAPEFFEIINRHYLGEYNPSSQTPTRFTPTEDAIKKFNLS